MLIVFHLGTFFVQKQRISVIILIDGFGGYIYVFWAIYSLRISFWIVPEIFFRFAPCFWATAMYIARRTAAGALMVIEVVTFSRGIPSKSISISLSESTATPHLPISPADFGLSES